MERFQSFSLDEWKQRYVDWIKSTKRRLMDFFRRADVKAYGFLTKKQFVEGMMSSGLYILKHSVTIFYTEKLKKKFFFYLFQVLKK